MNEGKIVGSNHLNNDFIMSPKIDFVFKLIFGDEKNIDILRGFLSAVFAISKEELEEIYLINTELYKWFKEDKKGILDVRVITKSKEQIDIEIQISPTKSMPERSLYYWSKMYSSQLKEGSSYKRLKKCIAINIVDFICIDIEKLHTVYHITEDTTKYKLTDILEIHFLELPKLEKFKISQNENDPIVRWMKFLNAKSKEVMKVLAQKDKDIEKAVHILEYLSEDEQARMAYEARQAQIRDEITREEEAIERGMEKGIKQGIKQGQMDEKIKIAKKMLLQKIDIEIISEVTDLSIDEINKIQ